MDLMMERTHEAPLEIVQEKSETVEDQMIYHCLYHYGEQDISLQYDRSKKKWSILNNGNEDLEMLVARFNVNEANLKFDDQIREIIRRLDEHFGRQHRTIDRDHLTLIVAPRSRQESSSSSIRDTSFLPASRSGRRMIQSMVLDVRRKGTFARLFHCSPSFSKIHRLGLHFLSVYDGKFNYPVGRLFDFPFERQMWLLTIEEIQYVQCERGAVEPKSLLILRYEGQSINVQA